LLKIAAFEDSGDWRPCVCGEIYWYQF